MSLISITIDISGSTALKQKMKDLNIDGQEHILKGYQDYLAHLFNIEMDFYYQLVNNGLEINKLFVPKIIGDEVWAVYNIDGVEPNTPIFNSLFNRILTSARTLCGKYYSISISERSLTIEEEFNHRLQGGIKFEHIPLVTRIYVDYISDFQEISRIRFDVFQKRFNDLFPIKPKITAQDRTERNKQFGNILQLLNIGMCLEDNNGKIKFAQRFDAVGFDIDLFFRCAGQSLPGFVGIGNKLFNLLYQNKRKEVGPNSFLTKYVLPTSINGSLSSIRNEFYICACQKLKADQLKGICSDYRIYYFFKDYDLRDIKNRASKLDHNPYKDTVEFLEKINFENGVTNITNG